MFRFILIFKLLITFSVPLWAQNTPVIVKISTRFGTMLFKLHDETPLHRDNFIKLIKSKHYDSLLFHRIIKDFVVQGGDPKSKYAKKDSLLGNGDLPYTIPAEFNINLFHKQGTLAMAREGDDVNPEKASSACQFYIVKGKVRQDSDIVKAHYRINKNLIIPVEKRMMERDSIGFKALSTKAKYKQLVDSVKNRTGYFQIPEEHIKAYKTTGGVPHLDNQYTVFGEMISGIEVLNKLAAVKTDSNDRPKSDLQMQITIVEPIKHVRQNRKNTKRR
jgi:peptidylprolyl isomerase